MITGLRILMTAGIAFALALGLTACAGFGGPNPSPLQGKIVCVDPGHGGTAETDHFRVGPTGEREEWIDLRVALILRDLLEQRGATVLLTRTEDVAVGLQDRARMAVDANADVFISIHHNATADPAVNFPIIYYHGNASENQASVALAEHLGRRIAKAMYDKKPPISVVSDHTIFPNSGAAVLRHSYGIPGVIGEASFFSNPAEELRLKDPDHNRREAVAYVQALEDFFASPQPPILEKYSTGKIPPLETLQEAERMQDVAKQWRDNYEAGVKLMESGSEKDLEKARDLLLLSARSFPDSPVARDCHVRLAEIADALGNPEEAAIERRRAEEYYVMVLD